VTSSKEERRATIAQALGLDPGSARWFVESTARHFTVRWEGTIAGFELRGGLRFFRSLPHEQTDAELELALLDGILRQAVQAQIETERSRREPIVIRGWT
jgi:hypothetical protein